MLSFGRSGLPVVGVGAVVTVVGLRRIHDPWAVVDAVGHDRTDEIAAGGFDLGAVVADKLDASVVENQRPLSTLRLAHATNVT